MFDTLTCVGPACIDGASLDMMKGNGGTVLLVTLKSRNWTKYVGLDTFDQL